MTEDYTILPFCTYCGLRIVQVGRENNWHHVPMSRDEEQVDTTHQIVLAYRYEES